MPHRTAHPAAARRPARLWAALCWALLATAPALADSPSALNTSTVGTYTVKPGDTAYSVARQAGTDVATLLSLNTLQTADLRPGQVLRLPGPPAPTPAVPRSHMVQAGQTLYAVARLYGLKAADVQAFNHLDTAELRPGQVLLLPAGGAAVQAQAAPPQAVQPPPPVPPTAPPRRYTVQAGQTLYAVARLYGLKAADVQAFNHLDSPDLRPGQVLLLPATPDVPTVEGPPAPGPSGAVFTPEVPLPAPPVMSVPGTSQPAPGSPDDGVAAVPVGGWRALALSLLGVPYAYGGSSRAGTDCSGLVVQVFGPLGLNLPRQSALQAQVGQAVDLDDLQAGDLLFFDTEGRGTVTHVGIYLGTYQGQTGAFINANSFGGQVAIDTLGEKYFAQRYLWARRVLGVLAQSR